jgi:hypothetical protein
LINSSTNDSKETQAINNQTLRDCIAWKEANNTSALQFHVLKQDNLPAKFAGAGLARKILMDEAVFRFHTISYAEGIIVSMDADTYYEPNYLESIEKAFNDREVTGASVYFSHPVEGDEYTEDIYHAIVQYELHLRYFVEGLRSSGFPYAYHTIGSAFAVRAKTYARHGGMNKKHAGEDFYFLHKIIPHGKYIEINNTKAIPSPRISNRVPFGTGPAIQSIIKSGVYLSYNPSGFADIKILLDAITDFYNANRTTISHLIKEFPDHLSAYLTKLGIIEKITEVNMNSSNAETFYKRFLGWFDAFQVVKYLNHAHKTVYQRIPVNECALQLLTMKKIPGKQNNCRQLLQQYRDLQRKNNQATIFLR